MSPEQSNGLVLDRRTDIFAFGAVLYEMLTGERAFPGETVGDVLAAVIRAEPDWSKLPTHTPSGIRRLLRRCLQKDRNRRLQTAGDAQIEIDEATGPDLNPVWSPDGHYVAFAGQRNGDWGIYQKASSNPTGGEELLYKSGNSPARPSNWSRDGRFLLFSAGSPYDIWMLPVNTGAAQGSTEQSRTLVDAGFNERGARLSPDGRYYAYVSNLSGQDEIYVQTFVDPSAPGDRPQTVTGKYLTPAEEARDGRMIVEKSYIERRAET